MPGEGDLEVHNNEEQDPEAEEQMARDLEEGKYDDEENAQEREAAQRAVLESQALRTALENPDPALDPEIAIVESQIAVLQDAVGSEVQNRHAPDQAAALERLNEQIGEIRQLIQNIPRPEQQSATRRYLSLTAKALGGISAILAILHFFGVGPFRSRAPAAKAAPTPPDVPNIANYWLRKQSPDPEKDFWESLARYVEGERPRPVAEQLLWMQYTLRLANATPPVAWTWSSPSEKIGFVKKLGAIITDTKTGGLAAAYRALPTFTHGPEQRRLPRAVSAELMSRALVDWWGEAA